MDKVDKLIIRAKRTAQRKAERFYMGFVNYDPDTGKWIAKAICGRVNGGADGGSQQSMIPWNPPWMRFRLWRTNTPLRLKMP